jgi:hypothetical protein
MELRRFHYICTAVAFVLSAMFVFGQPSPPEFIVSGPVRLYISSMIPVGAYQVTIGYNKSVVTLDPANVTGGTVPGFDGKPILVNADNTAGNVVVGHFQIQSAPTGTFSVAVFNFTGVGAGTSNLVLTVNALTDTASLELPLPPASVFLSPSTVTVTQKAQRRGQITSN